MILSQYWEARFSGHWSDRKTVVNNTVLSRSIHDLLLFSLIQMENWLDSRPVQLKSHFYIAIRTRGRSSTRCLLAARETYVGSGFVHNRAKSPIREDHFSQMLFVCGMIPLPEI